MQTLLPKELSWLSFNERVLQEASNPDVPLIERVRFMGIYSSNMDEYYRVRYADVRRLEAYSRGDKKTEYHKLLQKLRRKALSMQKEFERVYAANMKELHKHNIYLINEQQLKPGQADYVTQFFYDNVLLKLSPILLQDNSEPLNLNGDRIYLAVKLTLKDETHQLGLVDVPTHLLPRFIEIPAADKKDKQKVLIVLDNIIRHNLKAVFRGVVPNVKSVSAYTVKLTRDAELELGEGITKSLMDKISSSLVKRKKGEPVRFIYDKALPKDLYNVFEKKIKISRHDSTYAGSRYHNSRDFMGFPSLGKDDLVYPKLAPLAAKAFERFDNIFEAIREQDVMLYYPYHSFRYVTDFLYTAALDPDVKAVKITLYRVASDSDVVRALINAARNGKEVTAVVELQARFSEEDNLQWARKLTTAGVNVQFGLPGLKVHTKLIIIERMESNKLRRYAHIGTGNFNEKTARVYTDLSLFTYDQKITSEAEKSFDFILFSYKRYNFKQLSVSPHSNREHFIEAVENEIKNAKAGKKAEVMIKCNGLTDDNIVELLYKASQAGVKIKAIVRGMCSLMPGVKGLSENIKVISIVDRFLEHARIYTFHNDGKKQYFISSADLMTRNLDFRVEITCPVKEKKAKQLVQLILDTQWRDNVKARLLTGKQENKYVQSSDKPLRSQLELYKQIAKLT